MNRIISCRQAIGKLPAVALAASRRGFGGDQSSFEAAAAQVSEACKGTGMHHHHATCISSLRLCAVRNLREATARTHVSQSIATQTILRTPQLQRVYDSTCAEYMIT